MVGGGGGGGGRLPWVLAEQLLHAALETEGVWGALINSTCVRMPHLQMARKL